MRRIIYISVLALLAAGMTGCSRYVSALPVSGAVATLEDMQGDADVFEPAPEFAPDRIPDVISEEPAADGAGNEAVNEVVNEAIDEAVPENPGSPDISVPETEIIPEVTQEIQSEPETVPPTEMPAWKRAITDRAQAAYQTEYYIHDAAGVLSESEAEACTAYLKAAAGADSNALLVITDDLAGTAPADFAQVYYQALFGDEDGVLVLINHDTMEDSLYYAGAYRMNSTPDDIRIRILQATPCIVESRYADALEMLLS